MHDFPAENANPGKSEGGQSDFAKGSGRLRPPIVCIEFYEVSALQTISCLLHFSVLEYYFICILDLSMLC